MRSHDPWALVAFDDIPCDKHLRGLLDHERETVSVEVVVLDVRIVSLIPQVQPHPHALGEQTIGDAIDPPVGEAQAGDLGVHEVEPRDKCSW